MSNNKVRKDFTLSKASIAVLQQIKTVQGFGSYSSIVDSLILQKGIDENIIEVEERSGSLYEDKSIGYKYSESQTKFEAYLSETRREVAELADLVEKNNRTVKRALGDVEMIVYQIRDMLNSQFVYSQPQDLAEFKSADIEMREYEPHPFVKQSAENYDKRQHRMAVEKANDIYRSPHIKKGD